MPLRTMSVCRAALSLLKGLTAPLSRQLGMPKPFSSSSASCVKQMPPRPKLDPSEVEKTYLKGSGPGGQAINKTNSAVQLKHIPTGIVVKSQATRSRSQNLKIAMQILADKVDQQLNGDQSRSAIVGEVKRKRKASRAKKARRKYRKLEEEKKKKMEAEAAARGETVAEAEAAEEVAMEFEEGEEDDVPQSGSKATTDRTKTA
ncbi:hypothetical protein VTO42DRAFT_213 [Malbranchea cinnamomea]